MQSQHRDAFVYGMVGILIGASIGGTAAVCIGKWCRPVAGASRALTDDDLSHYEKKAKAFFLKGLEQRKRAVPYESSWDKASDNALKACRILRMREAKMQAICAQVFTEIYVNHGREQVALNQAVEEWSAALSTAATACPERDSADFARLMKKYCLAHQRLGYYAVEARAAVQQAIIQVETEHHDAESLPILREALQEAEQFKRR